MRLLCLTALCLTSMLAVGCNRFVSPATFDLQSVNVASVPHDWPGERVLTQAQQDMLKERGTPDCFRVRWDTRGDLVWHDQLWTQYHRQRVLDILAMMHHNDQPLPSISWIYQAEDQDGHERASLEEIFRGDEIIFTGEDRHEVEPVSDQLGVIMDVGDPEEIHSEPWRDHEVEHWRYYQEGRIYHFLDDELARVERITPTPIRVHNAVM